jgi:hypothetical protein
MILSVVICICIAAARATALTAALLSIRTANAGFPTLLGLVQIPHDAADNTQKNYDNDDVFHNLFFQRILCL